MKTNLDLHLHAQRSAEKLLEAKDGHPLIKAATAEFDASGVHPDDWDYWLGEFTRVRNHLNSAKTQPSKGARIWAAEAAAKAADEKKAAEATKQAQASGQAPPAAKAEEAN